MKSWEVWTQQAYLKASNVDGRDECGSAVSGDQVVVSANAEVSNGTGGQSDNSETASGPACIFKRTSGAWAQTDYLKVSNAESNDVSTMRAKNGSHHNLSHVQAQLSPQRTVTWTGAVPANGRVT